MGPVWAALLFLSLSGQLAALIIFDAFMRATDDELDVEAAPRMQVSLLDETPEPPEERPQVVQNSRVLPERPPRARARASEFDQRVERETQMSRLGDGRAPGREAPPPTTPPTTRPQDPQEARAPQKARPASEPRPTQARDRDGQTRDPEDAPASLVERDAGQAPSSPSSAVAPSAEALRSNPASLRGLFGTPGSLDRLEGVELGDENLFNTRRYRFASFFNRIREAVSERWHPEQIHRQRDPYGKIYGEQPRRTVLRVLLNPDGSLHRIYTEQGCGVDYLDEEAIRAMRRAAPFVNPPAELIDPKTGKIEFSFGFVLLFDGTKQIFRYQR